MTRIVAGTVGGRRLRTPPGDDTRPTTERVREALFSALESALGSLDGRRVLDLYAGSGAVGLEALSRGAAAAVLVERSRRVAGLIRRNAESLDLTGWAVVAEPVRSYLRTDPAEPFDVAFLDPPYALAGTELATVLTDLADRGWLADGAYVVVERSRRDPDPAWPEGIDPLRDRRYGETVLWYGRRAGATS
jgi:16S rRNA (guanine966-N2)-methyltransferase